MTMRVITRSVLSLQLMLTVTRSQQTWTREEETRLVGDRKKRLSLDRRLQIRIHIIRFEKQMRRNHLKLRDLGMHRTRMASCSLVVRRFEPGQSVFHRYLAVWSRQPLLYVVFLVTRSDLDLVSRREHPKVPLHRQGLASRFRQWGRQGG